MATNKYQKNSGYQFPCEDLLSIYILSLNWGVCCMSGATYGDIYPASIAEMWVAVIFMVLGATFYAKVFGDFVGIIDILRSEFTETM